MRLLLIASLLGGQDDCPEVTILDDYRYVASDAQDNGFVGGALDGSGNVIVIGSAVQKAYILTRSPSNAWDELILSAPPEISLDGGFGTSVAVSGAYLAIGARFDDGQGLDRGAVCIYEFSKNTWNLVQVVRATDGEDRDSFGSSLALEGETLVIGAPGDDDWGDGSGSVYAFVWDGISWEQQAKLVPLDATAGLGFGGAVDISGSRAVIGAAGSPPGGAAYVFQRGGTSWVQRARLGSASSGQGDGFGRVVAIDGSVVAVGAHLDDELGPYQGAAYVFFENGGSWLEQAQLLPFVVDPNAAAFGYSLDLDGSRLLVGARWAGGDNNPPGAAYLFEFNGLEWCGLSMLVEAPFQSILLGSSVCLLDNVMACGAPSAWETPPVNNGAVYIYALDGSTDIGTPFCLGVPCPCNNDYPGAGCRNSGGTGARMFTSAGSASIESDDLTLTVVGCPPGNSGIFFMGASAFDPVFVGDGLVCTGGLFRLLPGVVSVDGVLATNGVVAQVSEGLIQPGETRYFQSWTRDVLCGPPPSPCPSPCGGNSNLSSGVAVTFEP